MVLDLAQALDVPLRERNELLVAAGYAPIYSDQALDAPLMNSISKALQRMLRQHEPFPAIVMDRHWNVLMANDAAPQLFSCFVDLTKWPKPRNLLHLMFDPSVPARLRRELAGDGPRLAWSRVSRGARARHGRQNKGASRGTVAISRREARVASTIAR